MHWILILGLVVVLVAAFALTGAGPDGARPAGRTRLMSAARIVLVIVAVVVAFAVLRGI